MRLSLILCGLVVLLLPGRAARADLTADELLLIVNRNVPEGRQLAEFYQQARQVPEGRILELDLPAADRMTRSQYEQSVVPAVRQFLLDNGLREKVRCAVTFYGMPLIVEAKKLTELERLERAEVNQQVTEVAERLAGLVGDAERIATSVSYKAPPLRPREAQRLDVLLGRLGAVESFLAGAAGKLTAEQRQTLGSQVAELRERFSKPFAPDGEELPEIPALEALMGRTDEEGRRLTRQTLRTSAPLRNYAELLAQHQQLLAEEQSEACLDSELAALWINNAPAANWLVNPLARGASQARAGGPPMVLMVSRLDGRDPQQVRDLISTSLRIEKAGLDGKIVIDSRGIASEGAGGKADGYGVFDEQLRRLATLLEGAAVLPVVHDERPEVIQPPGERDVAVYVGWYSLKKYVDAFEFAEGAVGFHVASFEMQSLRNPRLPGWVRGLLDDGVVATLGPVSEPFLSAFPPPEEFVPLLLTGELTLAEVYWKTLPLMSWRLGLIGDPLYKPFAARPGLPAEALPVPLRLKLRE